MNYFGARYLDPMLRMWVSVDPARQFASPYLYAGNGMNPMNVVDPNGNETYQFIYYAHNMRYDVAMRIIHYALTFAENHPNADYAFRFAENQDELVKLINSGKTSVLITHGLEAEDGKGIKNFFGASINNPKIDMSYQDLNSKLLPGSSVKIFSCFANLSDDFSNVTPAREGLTVPLVSDYNTEVDGGNGAADAVKYLESEFAKDNGYTYDAY